MVYRKAPKFATAGLLIAIILSFSPLYAQNMDQVDISRAPVLPVKTMQDTSVTGGATAGAVVYRLDRTVPNNAFRVGEKLTFNIRYGIIKAGEAIMEVREKTLVFDSIPAYRIVTTAHSTPFFDAFYKVRDSVETYLDVRGLFSWKYEKRLREGGYLFDLLVEYDQRHGLANVHKIRYEDDKTWQIRDESRFAMSVPPYVLDVLGSFYFTRTQRLEVGEPIFITNHDNKKVYDLRIIVQRRERVEVAAGTFDCIVVKPVLQGEAIFKQKGELWIWLTDDEFKIPVKMKTKIAVGSITTELKSIEGIESPIRARIDK